ncbi:MAG: hypothetical protein A3H42_05085 [Deltaproteobacteria bacterium RIFCSPLOWO2_02_FULL_46_8]|nr:hypothetical protein [Deltaproteobacteria bacterium]OGQ44933.1 MAG: hypothetical protein A3H42_05085 [Deltaproteobacteria bacterium RIFCSPLOWO2_02_FULL_46_8]
MSEVLVVASKVKKYIKEKADMNTSGNSFEALTAVLKKTIDQAIEHAKQEGRKTVMDRDITL